MNEEQDNTISVSLDKEHFQRLEKLFGEDAARNIAKVAFEEWVDWITDTRRYMSIPDLEAHRVYTLYKNILPNRVPSSKHIGSDLNLIPSRAQYIVHSISYQDYPWWKARLREAIQDACHNARTITSKQGVYKVLNIDPDCKIFLDDAIQHLEDTGLISGKIRISHKMSGDTVRYEIYGEENLLNLTHWADTGEIPKNTQRNEPKPEKTHRGKTR